MIFWMRSTHKGYRRNAYKYIREKVVMRDVVLCGDSEGSFGEFARRLGFADVLPVFSSMQAARQSVQKGKGVIVPAEKIAQAKKEGLMVFAHASREAIERGADVVFGFEKLGGRDKMHYRDSGLNQVLCRLAAQKGVAIGFSFADVLSVQGAQRAVLLGRMMQNIRLCRKFKVAVRLGSFASSPKGMRGREDLISLFCSVGFSRSEVLAGFR